MAEKHLYEVRREGRVVCSYTDERCHYSQKEIESLKKAGFKLYIDGKQWKKPAQKK